MAKRWNRDLVKVAQRHDASEPKGRRSVLPLPVGLPPEPGRPTALLTRDQDRRVEDVDLAPLHLCAAGALSASSLRSPLPVPGLVQGFEAGAGDDAAPQSGFAEAAPRANDPASLARRDASAGITRIVASHIPCGPLREEMNEAAPSLAQQAIACCEGRRDWDTAIWPQAPAGIFAVKQTLPRLVDQMLPA